MPVANDDYRPYSPGCFSQAAEQAEAYFLISTAAWLCVDKRHTATAHATMLDAIDLARHASTTAIRWQARRLVRDFYRAYHAALPDSQRNDWVRFCSDNGLMGGWITDCRPNAQDDVTAMFLGHVPVLATPDDLIDGGHVA